MTPSRFLRSALAGLLLAAGTAGAVPTASVPEFSDWPAGTAPAEVGRRVAENFAARSFQWQTDPKRRYVIYPEICAWYGALTVAGLSGDTALRDRLYAKYDVLLTPEGAARVSPDAHVDYRIFGVVPLEFQVQGRGDAWRAIGLTYADAQWGNPVIADGVSPEARWWIDDMYMLPILQVQAYRASRQAKYLDRAALTMAAYLDKLQQPNGLFLHAPDSPFYWGRGNGWVAAGMAELLRDLPADHPHHARILAGYRAMMAALLPVQGTDGLWKQLVDKPESWGETSATGMFTFALVTGVKSGWLNAKDYAPAARRAWLALVAHLDDDANLAEVCVGTDKARKTTKSDDLKVQYDFYQARPRRSGDLHGQAPVLWTASALLR
ncbi:Unsaturated rhamnogalacturonyl hydrolase YteR [Lacunisphaera limnophila]|uniref:Unsaturated rhamnogalacturonyl hydrolase YteR n=1 Tax=Lacunisphaera limnophila TaxID=1838286 RepID=A0A1D8ATJ7_9BACT|nr:glycoside hydrolase family 88 protein [Lacunisphaera limnophila]AOS44225.1 Unsaturated rhamnogalacturonyl hydrolase YteR [Lacunisphaera limnophila]